MKILIYSPPKYPEYYPLSFEKDDNENSNRIDHM